MSTVLLVENDPDIRHLIAHQLGRSGLAVVEAGTGIAGLREARLGPPDLVIVDIRLPDVSGFDVCRELRAGPGTAAVPIIMLTARARPHELEQTFAVGATDYLVMPFGPRDVQERVNSALARTSP
jgi:two-component system, OmpR family, phosphate regulon response regulator PhoB